MIRLQVGDIVYDLALFGLMGKDNRSGALSPYGINVDSKYPYRGCMDLVWIKRPTLLLHCYRLVNW